MYIGNDLQIAHPSYKIIDDISSGFNGSTTSFALQVSGATPVPFPISTQQVMISVNGVVQEPDPNGSAGFKLLGSNIVFSSAPANGHAFFGVINAGADYVTAGSEFPDGSATAPSFTFQDDQDTGWFRSGSGSVGYSANGVQTLTFDGNGLTVTGDASFVGDSSKNLLWDKSDGQLEFADNAKAIFGTGADLQIYHDGSVSKITNSTGNFIIEASASGVIALKPHTNENGIITRANGASELYYDNSKKFETTTTGATVTGTLASTGLSLSGDLIASNNAWLYSTNGGTGARAGINLSGSTQAIDFVTAGSSNVRMRIDSSGRLLIGDTTHRTGQKLEVSDTGSTGSLSLRRYSANAHPSYIDFFKSRSGTLGGETVVQSGDNLGQITWGGSDGTDRAYAAFISGVVDGTPGAGDMPGRLVFSTSADGSETPTERMRIDSAGMIGVNMTPQTSAGSTYMLQISSGGTQCFMSLGNNTSGVGPNNGVVIGNDASNAYLWNREATPMQLGTSDLVRFQIGAAGQLGVGGASYGTSGQVLTSGGASAAPSWTSISAAPEITGTVASGASLAANDAVLINPTDGTLNKVTQVAESIGSVGEFSDSSNFMRAAYNPSTGKIIVVYQKQSASYHGKYKVGTVTGTSISWGSEGNIGGGSSEEMSMPAVAFYPPTGQIVVATRRQTGHTSGSAGQGFAVVGTISGTSVTWGSWANFSSNNYTANEIDICYDPKHDTMAIPYQANTYYGLIEIGTVASSGNSISFPGGGGSSFHWSGSPRVRYPRAFYNPDEETLCVAYINQNDSSKGYIQAANVALNSSSQYNFVASRLSLSGNHGGGGFRVTYDTTRKRIVGIISISDQPRLCLASQSGTTMTLVNSNVANIFSSGHGWNDIKFDAKSGKCFCITGWDNGLDINTITVNADDTITQGSASEVQAGNDKRYPVLSYASNTDGTLGSSDGKYIACWQDYTSSSNEDGAFVVKQMPSTTLDAEQFIGFSAGSYSASATAKVKVNSNTLTGLSGLSPTKTYYVQGNGTLGLTAVNPSVVAGKAINSSTLLIKS